MKKLFKFSFAIVGVFLLTMVLALAMPLYAAAPIAIGSTLFSAPETGIAFSGLNKEIWLADLKEKFYADSSFLNDMVDMSAFVSNDTINLAEAGVDPNVLINNTSYPIAYAQRTDVPIALPLDTYDTENTLVQNIEIAEISYDKRQSVMYGHKQALLMTFMQKSGHAVAPATDSTYTPIVQATGTTANENGLKRLIYADLLRLRKRFDNAEIPAEGRVIVLSAQHLEDLEIEDAARFNRIMDKGFVAGFKMRVLAEKRLPRYHKTTGAKIAYGAAPSANDSTASIAWHDKEMMKAMGTMDMFLREKDPELRGDMIGFQMRALSIPIRNKGVASLYSPVL